MQQYTDGYSSYRSFDGEHYDSGSLRISMGNTLVDCVVSTEKYLRGWDETDWVVTQNATGVVVWSSVTLMQHASKI